MILASDLAKDWGINISQIPPPAAARRNGCLKKAVSIGNYVVATGIDTYLGVDPYSKGSSEITELLQGETRGCKEVGSRRTSSSTPTLRASATR